MLTKNASYKYDVALENFGFALSSIPQIAPLISPQTSKKFSHSIMTKTQPWNSILIEKNYLMKLRAN